MGEKEEERRARERERERRSGRSDLKEGRRKKKKKKKKMVIPSQKALEDALARCEHAGPTKNAKPAPPQEVRKLLKIIRDGKVRLPDVVSKHGARLLSSKGWRTLKPDELWLVHEQVCLACLDTGDVDEAKRIIQKLDKRFPNSLRVAVLKGALFECCEDFDQADEIYKAGLEEKMLHCKGSGQHRKGHWNAKRISRCLHDGSRSVGGVSKLVPFDEFAQAGVLLLRGAHPDSTSEPKLPPQVRRSALQHRKQREPALASRGDRLLQRCFGPHQRVQCPRHVRHTVVRGGNQVAGKRPAVQTVRERGRARGEGHHETDLLVREQAAGASSARERNDPFLLLLKQKWVKEASATGGTCSVMRCDGSLYFCK